MRKAVCELSKIAYPTVISPQRGARLRVYEDSHAALGIVSPTFLPLQRKRGSLAYSAVIRPIQRIRKETANSKDKLRQTERPWVLCKSIHNKRNASDCKPCKYSAK
jgi:hypothetical protein